MAGSDNTSDTIAVVFPGQGSQKIGMARDFYDAFCVSRAVFDEVSERLSVDMAKLCFEDEDRLNLTTFTQPALLTAEIAVYRALTEEYGVVFDYFAGHSLGEYSALVAAGVIPLSEAATLVRQRGLSMQKAVPIGRGAMVAVTSQMLDLDGLQEQIKGLSVDIANVNSPQQVVLSGEVQDVHQAEQRIERWSSSVPIRLTRLSVSAPFHSRLMVCVEEEYRPHLVQSSQTWNPRRAHRVLSNHTGDFYEEGSIDGLVNGLTNQISGTVMWLSNMHRIVSLNPNQIVEVGPRRPLRGFFWTMGVEVTAITNLVTAKRAWS